MSGKTKADVARWSDAMLIEAARVASTLVSVTDSIIVLEMAKRFKQQQSELDRMRKLVREARYMIFDYITEYKLHPINVNPAWVQSATRWLYAAGEVGE